jgi:hypothetical protein
MAVPVIKAEQKVEVASNPAPTQNIEIALR